MNTTNEKQVFDLRPMTDEEIQSVAGAQSFLESLFSSPREKGDMNRTPCTIGIRG